MRQGKKKPKTKQLNLDLIAHLEEFHSWGFEAFRSSSYAVSLNTCAFNQQKKDSQDTSASAADTCFKQWTDLRGMLNSCA